MNKTEILNRLDKSEFYKNHISSLKINGKPEAIGLCPFHEDHDPSLSVNVESGLYTCRSCGEKGDVFTFYQKIKGVNFSTALREIGQMVGIVDDTSVKPMEKKPSKIECAYQYTDEVGKMLFEVVRFVPKTFRQRQPNGKGGYINNMTGVRIVPYNLPAVIASDIVYICEGEKDCDNLTKLGLTATTNPQGAGKWREEFKRYFTGKDVVILCDNDEPGRKHGHDVAQKLNGGAKAIKVVEQMPGVPAKGDISDWLLLSDSTREKLLEIVENASLWTPTEWTSKEIGKNHSIMELTRLDNLFSEPEETTEWLVDGLLPSGGFSVLVAKPKVGKSTVARGLALCVARGEPFLGKDVYPGVVVYLALEEKRTEIKRHFQDMGATGKEEIYIYTGGTPVNAIQQIRVAVETLKPVLLIIDPLFRLTKVKDGNDYIQVTNALDPLLRIARELKTHVQCIHHSPKRDSCQGGDDVLGSTAIFGSVDTLMIMKRHEHYRTLQTIQRYGLDLEETVLDFNKGKRVVTIGGSRQEMDMGVLENAILDFLSKQKEPVIEKVVTDEIEGRTALKRKTLRELLGNGKIMRIGKGGKGDPFRYSCSQNACSQEMLVPDVGNESGTSKNEQNNYLEINACSRVPDIYGEQQKKECKKPCNPHGCKGNACSRVPVFPEAEKNCREQAFMTKKESDGDGGNAMQNEEGKTSPDYIESVEAEIPEVEFVEVIRNV